MRKVLIAAVVAVAAVSGLALNASADKGQQDTEWTFTFSKNRVNTAVGSNSLILPAKRDDKGTADESDDTYSPPKTSTILFPKGSSVDTGAMPQCKLTASEAGRGEQCPKNTNLGDGEAVSLIGATPAGGGTRLNSTIDAFNKKSTILFIIQPCETNTGPTTDKECAPAGSTIVLEGTWSNTAKQPKLVVPTPQGLIDIGVTILRFRLTTDLHTKKTTKTVNGKKVTVIRSFAFTPKTCTGKWVSSATEVYTDGSKQTIKDSQKCRKP